MREATLIMHQRESRERTDPPPVPFHCFACGYPQANADATHCSECGLDVATSAALRERASAPIRGLRRALTLVRWSSLAWALGWIWLLLLPMSSPELFRFPESLEEVLQRLLLLFVVLAVFIAPLMPWLAGWFWSAIRNVGEYLPKAERQRRFVLASLATVVLLSVGGVGGARAPIELKTAIGVIGIAAQLWFGLSLLGYLSAIEADLGQPARALSRAMLVCVVLLTSARLPILAETAWRALGRAFAMLFVATNVLTLAMLWWRLGAIVAVLRRGASLRRNVDLPLSSVEPPTAPRPDVA